jgi:hypothetical protein
VVLELPGGGDRDQGRVMTSGGQPVSESPVCTGNPWIAISTCGSGGRGLRVRPKVS